MTLVGAVDIGASGGRVIAGTVADGAIELRPVHRFANHTAHVDGHLRWDVDSLVSEIIAGVAALDTPASIGIDTWGCDYGLLRADGTLVDAPISYRDDRTAAAVDAVHDVISPADLYAVTGLQFLPFNTIYQLVADRLAERIGGDADVRAVLIADLIAQRLTGELATEVTNASTTGLLDATSKQWSAEVLRRCGLADDLFPPLQQPGDRRGVTSDGVPVITVGSHDTASAVVGLPATGERFAYVVCGTWSLVGVELDAPVLSADAQAANFTNEAGVDGRTRFLRNVGGLWLLQECQREWRRETVADLEALLAAAAELRPGGPQIDVDDRAFIPPGQMPARIRAAAERPDLDDVAVVRCILDSLAAAYARTIDQAAALTGRRVDVVHLVGGGARNTLLCQLTADATGLPVVAGPVEATALGNVVVQARTLGLLPASLDAIRERLAASLALTRYSP